MARFGIWALAVLLFATQWYFYDTTRQDASPYAYYFGWSCFIWAFAPLVLWFAGQHPFNARRGSARLHCTPARALHSASAGLVEGSIGWLRMRHELILAPRWRTTSRSMRSSIC